MNRIVVCLTVVAGGFLSALSPVCLGAGLSPAELLQLGLEVRYSTQAVLNVNRDTVVHVTNDESNVYVQSSGGMLTAFNAENGRKLWAVQVGLNNEPSMAAVTNDNTVLVMAGPMAYGYDKFTGIARFEQRMPKTPSAAPAIHEGGFFAPVEGGALYSYDLRTLEYKFRYDKLPDTKSRAFMWRFICGEEIIHPPVIGDGAVTFATERNSLFSVVTTGIEIGKTRLQLVLNEPVTADLATSPNNKRGNSVLMLTGENRVFSVKQLSGTTEWTYPMGRGMSDPPIVVGDFVYVVTDDGTMTRISRDETSLSWGRPVETPKWVPPLFIGAGMTDAEPDVEGVVVKYIVPGSPANVAGLLPGDILNVIDGQEVTTLDNARDFLSELPPRAPRTILVTRNGQTQRLPIVIPVTQWEAGGVLSLSAVGRFSIFAIDQAERLVAFDKQTGEIQGRVQAQGYQVRHHNKETDQVFLVSSSGEIICLREIGPKVTMPELSTVSPIATITEVKVGYGDPIPPTGTAVCVVELPDGTTQEISSSHAGTVREIYVRQGQKVNIGDPLIMIGDDRFASYHRKPQQRPIDVDVMDPNAPKPPVDPDS